MQFISNDETMVSNTVQDLKDFNSQFLAKQDKKGEKLVSLLPVIKKAFDLVGDDVVEIFTKNESLKK